METGSKDANFGGMEKAFSAKTMMRHDAYFDIVKGEAIRLPWKEPQTTKENKKRKRSRREINRTWGRWASLPDHLIVSIMMTLNIVDYFAFGGVCRSWKTVATDWRDYYMKRQKPLVVVKSKHAKKSCFLYNIFDGEEYKTRLPDLRGKFFLGLSCGYVITLDMNSNFWLINLMTRHELRFPVFPKDKKRIVESNFRSVLFQSTYISHVFMIVFSRVSSHLVVSHNGAQRWKVYTLPNMTSGIADVKVFRKKIYVLSVDAHIFVLNLSAGVMKLNIGNTSILKFPFTFTHLVILDNQLCLRAVNSFDMDSEENVLYQLDTTEMLWVKKKEMGKYSLFLDQGNATMVDASEWGAGNCICYLKSWLSSKWLTNYWSLHLLDRRERLGKVPVVWNGNDQLVPFFWYFPGESYTIDRVG